MSNAATLPAAADTMPSSDYATLSAESRDASEPKSLSNWAVSSVLVGALSAFAALGVVISEYYINPEPPARVAVAPGAVSEHSDFTGAIALVL
jgi:hypothetical protein